MKIFKLPDLGEGLPDAVIREWYVKEGETVNADQPIAAMETAKALVDVPAPFAGKIEKLFGNPGDTIETGKPLVGFEGEGVETVAKDSGTVVGAIEESEKILKESAAGVVASKTTTQSIKATPAVRQLAKQLHVDLASITPSGPTITAENVKRASGFSQKKTGTIVEGELQALSQVQRAMVQSISRSHAEVAHVTLTDDADLHQWQGKQDVTIRMIRAIQEAVKAEPMLNVYFDSERIGYKKNDVINLGMAVDTPQGLYVPVLKDIANQSDDALRQTIDRLKAQAQNRSISKEDLHGATIMLSNFGAYAGRYANPLIIPPMVAIIGVGRSRETIVPEQGKPAIHRILPLSVTTDHRIITGGEMARFLKTLILSLEKPT